jgi:hypothetical protein
VDGLLLPLSLGGAAGCRRRGAVHVQPEATVAAGSGGVLRCCVQSRPIHPHLRGLGASTAPPAGGYLWLLPPSPYQIVAADSRIIAFVVSPISGAL